MSALSRQVAETLRKSEDNPTGWEDGTFVDASTGQVVAIVDIVETVIRAAAPALYRESRVTTLRWVAEAFRARSGSSAVPDSECAYLTELADRVAGWADEVENEIKGGTY